MPSPAEPHRFIEVLKPDRCPICFLTGDYGHDHVRNLLEESVTDPDSRDVLFASRGFCRRHAWKAVAQGQTLGMAAIYASLLEKGLKDLKPTYGFLDRPKQEPCPICESESRREKVAISQFALCWNESVDLRTAFFTHGILCLGHLEKLLAERIPAEHRKNLFETAKKALERILKELNEFLQKQDYHRSLEAVGQERDAWVRAVRMIAGERE